MIPTKLTDYDAEGRLADIKKRPAPFYSSASLMTNQTKRPDPFDVFLGFATKLEMGAEEAINNSLYVKPFGWGQLGGAGSIGAGIHGLKQAYGMLSYTSSILNQQIKKTIEHLPAGHKADFYANLGVTEIHSIDVNPDYDGILLNSYMGHLDPENEIRTVRFALLELEAGNFEGAKRDLATALRNLRKYGSVTVNGSVQIDGSFAF